MKAEIPRLLEEERQLLLMALANLATQRPGWEPTLRDLAVKFDGEALFAVFKEQAGGRRGP